MRVLITGAAGFVGRHMVHELANSGHTALACDLGFDVSVDGADDHIELDVCSADAVRQVVDQIAPDACVHLAALAFVPDGGADPERLLSVNINGTMNVLEAFRRHEQPVRLLVVSTSHVYGLSRRSVPITETTALAPVSLYAASKAAADLMALGYARDHGMPIMTARPNNHTGPGQKPPFAVPAFAYQLHAMAHGQAEPVLRAGNLESERAFLDVRDVVQAYRLLLEKGQPGEAYNVSSDTQFPMQSVVDKLSALLNVTPTIEVDPDRFRPTDRSPTLASTKIHEHTGWRPTIDFDTTLRDLVAAL